MHHYPYCVHFAGGPMALYCGSSSHMVSIPMDGLYIQFVRLSLLSLASVSILLCLSDMLYRHTIM